MVGCGVVHMPQLACNERCRRMCVLRGHSSAAVHAFGTAGDICRCGAHWWLVSLDAGCVNARRCCCCGLAVVARAAAGSSAEVQQQQPMAAVSACRKAAVQQQRGSSIQLAVCDSILPLDCCSSCWASPWLTARLLCVGGLGDNAM